MISAKSKKKHAWNNLSSLKYNFSDIILTGISDYKRLEII